MKIKRHKGLFQLLVLLLAELVSMWAIYLKGFDIAALP